MRIFCFRKVNGLTISGPVGFDKLAFYWSARINNK